MTRFIRLARLFAGVGTACLLALGSIAAHADAGSLRARHAELKPQLQGNSYGRQMCIDSAEGPFGTHDYRVNVEAVPLESGKTFMHMNYAYGYGGTGKFAMQAYLATAGANKSGFTSDGLRGAVERNAMRYYLAIDAYLDTMDAAQGERVDKRINQWFSATERYPRQLHEMDRDTYVTMKRQEYGREKTASAR